MDNDKITFEPYPIFLFLDNLFLVNVNPTGTIMQKGNRIRTTPTHYVFHLQPPRENFLYRTFVVDDYAARFLPPAFLYIINKCNLFTHL